jgi:hypothetical protein
MRVMREVPMMMPPSTGSAPPERPVPAPRGTIGMPASHASRTQAATSSVEAGRTTIAGRIRMPSSPSHSYVRRSLGALNVLRAPTIAAKRAGSSAVTGASIMLRGAPFARTRAVPASASAAGARSKFSAAGKVP